MKEEEKQLINKTRRTKTSQRTSKEHNILDKAYLKQEKGITLIALVITIIILIILATVTLNVVLGEGGLIDRAQQAKDLTEQAVLEEQQGLNSLMDEMANIMAEDQTPPEPEMPTIDDAKPNPDEDGPKYDNTTTIKDDLENEVTIPGGFHIDEDSGTKVEEGIVIEDGNGNQFVWIPVGEYNVSTTINSTGKLTNELTRRTFTDSGSTPVNGDDVIEEYYYGEGDSRSVAYGEIDAFLESAKPVSEGGHGGFYIGRYEQGEGNVCKAGVTPYVNVTRDEAKEQAEAMYSSNGEIKATSQLISSYAWDTALNFICQTNEEGYLLATTTDDAYGNIGTQTQTQTGGYPADCYSNIYDFLGNYWEWTTEYSSYYNPCVGRGGSYDNSNFYAAYRYNVGTSVSSTTISFRSQLYV